MALAVLLLALGGVFLAALVAALFAKLARQDQAIGYLLDDVDRLNGAVFEDEEEIAGEVAGE
jgi:hypothetical protein